MSEQGTACDVADVERVDPALAVLPTSGGGGTGVVGPLMAVAELMDRGRLSPDEYRRVNEAVVPGGPAGARA